MTTPLLCPVCSGKDQTQSHRWRWLGQRVALGYKFHPIFIRLHFWILNIQVIFWMNDTLTDVYHIHTSIYNSEILWLQLTTVYAAKLRREGNVINRNTPTTRTVKGHFKNHLRRQQWQQASKWKCWNRTFFEPGPFILTWTGYGAFRSTWTGTHSLSVPLQSLWFWASAFHSSWYWPMESLVNTENMFPLSSLRWYWKLRHPDRGTVVIGDTSLATSLKVLA